MGTIDKLSHAARVALLSERADDLAFAARALLASVEGLPSTTDKEKTLWDDCEDAQSIAYGLRDRIKEHVRTQL